MVYVQVPLSPGFDRSFVVKQQFGRFEIYSDNKVFMALEVWAFEISVSSLNLTEIYKLATELEPLSYEYLSLP